MKLKGLLLLIVAVATTTLSAYSQYNLHYTNNKSCTLLIQVWDDGGTGTCSIGSTNNFCVPGSSSSIPGPPLFSTAGGTQFLFVTVFSYGNSTCTAPSGHGTPPCSEGYHVAFPPPAPCPNFTGIPDHVNVSEVCGYCSSSSFDLQIVHLSGNDYELVIN